MVNVRYILKKIDNELCLCRCTYKGIMQYITLKELREIDDDLYDKLYNNQSNNQNVRKVFKHDCFMFFKKRGNIDVKD